MCAPNYLKEIFNMEKCGVKEFLKRKNVTITVQTYLIDALGAMAFGLFASLLIGTIFGTLGQQFNLTIFNVIADYAKSATGVLIAQSVGPGVAGFMNWFGILVKTSTELQPFFMGILVSALIGIALTLPISSAAICIALSLDGLAGGAATAGCCAQMIGFAVLSFRENGVGGLMAQGLGTSMLQMGNIVKNPKVWIAPTLTSMITGPIATMVFQLKNIPAGSGMGTCGLVGPIGVYTAMRGGTFMWLGILMVCFLLPAVLTLLFGEILRKIGWIKYGDLTLDLK